MGHRKAGMVAIGLGMVVFLGLSGVALGTVADQRAPIRLDDADNGRNINARPNDTIVVSIRNCFTCGYRWDVTQGPDPQVVAYRSEEDQRAPAGSPDGAPEYRRFTFVAVSAGATDITISYFPPSSSWRQGRSESTYRLSLTVVGAAPPASPAEPEPADIRRAEPAPVSASANPPPRPSAGIRPPAPAPGAVTAVERPAVTGGEEALGPPVPSREEALGPPVPIGPPVPMIPPHLASNRPAPPTGREGNRGGLLVGAALALSGLAVIVRPRWSR